MHHQYTTNIHNFHFEVSYIFIWQFGSDESCLIVELEMKNLPTKTCRMSGSVCSFFFLFWWFSTQVPQHDVLQRCGHLGLFLCLDCCCLWSKSSTSPGLLFGCSLFLGKKAQHSMQRERDLHQSHWLESRRYFSKDEPPGFVLIAHYMCN